MTVGHLCVGRTDIRVVEQMCWSLLDKQSIGHKLGDQKMIDTDYLSLDESHG